MIIVIIMIIVVMLAVLLVCYQMTGTGMPQLKSMEDIQYLRESFMVGKSEEDASAAFTSLIHESLNTKTTQVGQTLCGRQSCTLVYMGVFVVMILFVLVAYF